MTGDGTKELDTKVLEWLQSEGYPLEFRTAREFHKAAFRVWQGVYVRADDQPPREIDVLGFVDATHRDTTLRVTHVVECKWSWDSPWVVLASEHGQMASSACIAQTIGDDIAGALLWHSIGDPEVATLGMFATPDRGTGEPRARSAEARLKCRLGQLQSRRTT